MIIIIIIIIIRPICITTANCQYRNWSEFCGPSVCAETLQGSDAGASGHSSPASGPAAGGGACGLGWGSPRRRLGPSSPGGPAASPALWEIGLHGRTGLARWCAEPVSGQTRCGRPAPQSARCATQRWRTPRHCARTPCRRWRGRRGKRLLSWACTRSTVSCWRWDRCSRRVQPRRGRWRSWPPAPLHSWSFPAHGPRSSVGGCPRLDVFGRRWQSSPWSCPRWAASCCSSTTQRCHWRRPGGWSLCRWHGSTPRRQCRPQTSLGACPPAGHWPWRGRRWGRHEFPRARLHSPAASHWRSAPLSLAADSNILCIYKRINQLKQAQTLGKQQNIDRQTRFSHNLIVD